MMRRLATVLRPVVPLCLLVATASAQQKEPGPLSQRLYDVFELRAGSPTHVFTIPVSAGSTLMIDVTMKAASVGVQITNPLGVALDATQIERFVVGANAVPPLGGALFEAGEHAQADINAPLAGNWTVRLTLPSGSPSASGSITAILTGGLSIGLTSSRPLYQAGQDVTLALLAFRGSTAVVSGVVRAVIYPTVQPTATVAVAFRDDGQGGDTASSDGVYTAVVRSLAPGHYVVEASLQSGNDRSVASTSVEVIPRMAMLAGSKSDVGVDVNGDGLFETTRIGIDVNVASAGNYRVLASLTSASGVGEARGVAEAALSVGAGSIPVSFSADDIRGLLGVDGPWYVKNVSLVRIGRDGSSRDLLLDQRADLGPTAAYRLLQLQRPITIIRPVVAEGGVDRDGNGLFDLLQVDFQVDTLRAGTYTWTGNLRAPDGTHLDVATGQGSLAAGVTTVSFTFDGRTIGTTLLDGPYAIVDVAAYGPSAAAALSAHIGTTRSYLASQFEGSRATFDRLFETLQTLVITGRGGVPQAEVIRTSLLQKATEARSQSNSGNVTSAAVALDALAAQVRSLDSERLDTGDKDRLLDLIARVRATL